MTKPSLLKTSSNLELARRVSTEATQVPFTRSINAYSDFTMKINLVVSNCTELWIEGADRIQFLIEDCRDQALARGSRPAQCLISPWPMTDTQGSIDFIEGCLTKCLLLVAGKLAEHHGHGVAFWKQVIFFYLRDLIGSAYTIFAQIEGVFDPAVHDLRIAALPDKIPLYGGGSTIEDALYWGITDEGREYYAAEYFRTFYPGMFPELPLSRKGFGITPTGTAPSSVVATIKNAVKERLRRRRRRLRVMVVNAQYDLGLARRVFLRSLGRVSLYHTVPSLESLFEETYILDSDLRKDVAAPLASSQDRFEQYLGHCLETSLPWSLAEGFKCSYAFYREFWATFPRLQYVISENMYQHHALSRAVCALHGTETITLPHFYPLEIFSPARLNHLQVQERFIARGKAPVSSLAIGSGTAFPYQLAVKHKQKTIDTLYVATDFYAHFQSLQQSADGCGYDVFMKYRKFVDAFLAELPKNAIDKISLKKRPPSLLTSIQMDYLRAMKLLEPSVPAKNYMAKAKLVLVEGLSTSLFEALASDIPTIAFWPADIYHFSPAFEAYFSILEEAGIVLHDPCVLAQQVAMVQPGPDSWWGSPAIRAGRERFLNLNLHSNRDFERVLLDLARGKIASPIQAS